MDKEIIRLARDQIRLEITEEIVGLQAEIGRIKTEMAARGLSNSGAVLLKVAQACAGATRERGRLAWATLHRYITTAEVPYNEELANDLKAVVGEFLPSGSDLKGYLGQEAQHLVNPRMATELIEVVEEARATVLAKMANEIDLFAASLKRQRYGTTETISDLGERDALTKLRTRGAMDSELPRVLAEAEKSNHPLSVVMLDVDHFKKVNDTYGHPKGDAVLVETAAHIISIVEGKGRAYRYGGEEIVILLPNHSLQEAIAVAERARRSLESARPSDLTITASFGVGTFPEHGRTTAEIIGAADRALYDAKNQGRNLVKVFMEPALPERAREPERKAPTPGALTEKEKADLKLLHFRGVRILCPKDGAILTVYESTQVGSAIATLLVICKVCGLQERL